MNICLIIVCIVVSIICAFIHKNKGYSPIAGFCWGFFFSVLGLAVVLLTKDKEGDFVDYCCRVFFFVLGLVVVLLEKDKEEHDVDMENKDGLSMVKCICIFIGIGIVFITILFITILVFMSLFDLTLFDINI